MSKKLLVTKTFYFAVTTLISRFLGFARELIKVKCLGIGLLSDMFLIVFRLPNALYKIFAEGVISSALVPYATKLMQEEDEHAVHKLLTLFFGILLLFFFIVSLIMIIAAEWCLWFIAPGWFTAASDVTLITQSCTVLRILMFSIFFLAGSSFLSGALHIKNNFYISSLQPAIMNILLISQFVGIYLYELSISTLAWCYLLNSCIVFVVSLNSYLQHIDFVWPFDRPTYLHAKRLMFRLVPSFINMGILEINTFIDTIFASFYSNGFISLLNHSGAFLRVPLSIFATSFATILLPYLSRLSISSPRRIDYHIHEIIKALLWLTMPATFLFVFFSHDIFATIFPRITDAQLILAQQIVTACGSGLFFFSLNRVLLTVYYALGETTLPTYFSLINVCINIMGNFLLTSLWGPVGIVWATTYASIVQTFLLVWFLITKFHVVIYGKRLFEFIIKACAQQLCALLFFMITYTISLALIQHYAGHYTHFLIYRFGLWLWVGPLVLISSLLLWTTRRLFGIKLYYFD